jgi:dynein heavy chain, axonemal
LLPTQPDAAPGAGVIKARVLEAEQTEVAINAAREKYRTVPVRAAVLFFNIADLAVIDPMYRYSLTYFIQLFKHCVEAAAPAEDLPTRLDNLLSFTTQHMFTTVRSPCLLHSLTAQYGCTTEVHGALSSPPKWAPS